MADLLKRGMPKWTPLRLKEIIMNKVPNLSLGPGTKNKKEKKKKRNKKR